MIRVLLADDHTLVRQGLKQLFAAYPHIEIAAEAADGGQVLEQLRNRTFDLLLLDVSMPGMVSGDLLERVRSYYPQLPVLILSMHNEAQIARRKLQEGASGYLTKDCEPEVLLEAIERVVKGGRYISAELAERIAFETGRSDDDASPELSRREQQILQLLASGCNQNEIAERLAISNKTVSTHKTRLMRKLGFGSNAELIRYAVSRGMVE